MLKVAPLGGLGEVGLNTMVLEHGGERVLVDCGLMFPRGDQFGVDVVLPDFSLLTGDPDSFKAVVLTHAHEDHIGALPWLLRDFNVPVYGTPFTIALVRHRLEEVGVKADLREIEPKTRFKVGEQFDFEAVRVTHSVPDAVGLIARTPSATLIHSGDFKLDGMPIDGQLTDLTRFAEVGEEGVDVLMSDSTNSEVSGWTGSEQLVNDTFGRYFATATGRIVIAMFGSHLHRVRHTIELAQRHRRKVLLLGRSLQRNVELAQQVGILGKYPETLIPYEAAPSVPPSALVIVCTGAQAEPRSALMQLLNPEPGPLRIDRDDLVLLSSRTIPGNEPNVTVLLNRLLARGARVIYSSIEPGIHVSGHASRDEQLKLLETVKPRNFVPIHGELRHLHQHLATARSTGMAESKLVLMVDGDVAGFDRQQSARLGRVPFGKRLMRREGLAAISEATLAERRWLAEVGVIVAVVVLRMGSGTVLFGPTLHQHGLQGEEAAALTLAAEGARFNLSTLSEAMRGDDERVREEVVRGVRRVFKQLFGSRPLVMPIVARVP
jgi:ribonuclease J